MGRRVRHLNPVHAGAGYAIDARFLSGLSNGANVTSWTSRPGKTFDFTGASNYPTFSASVAAAANQPGVAFLGTSSQRLISTNPKILASGSTTWTHVEFSTNGSNLVTFVQKGIGGSTNNTGIGCTFTDSGVGGLDVATRVGTHIYYSDPATSTSQLLSSTPTTNGFVFSIRQNGTAQQSRNRWEAINSRVSSGSLRETAVNAPADFRTGTHHASCLFPVALSDSLHRRIVEHYAYSFKSAI